MQQSRSDIYGYQVSGGQIEKVYYRSQPTSVNRLHQSPRVETYVQQTALSLYSSCSVASPSLIDLEMT
jgi:hypothetical protein